MDELIKVLTRIAESLEKTQAAPSQMPPDSLLRKMMYKMAEIKAGDLRRSQKPRVDKGKR